MKEAGLVGFNPGTSKGSAFGVHCILHHNLFSPSLESSMGTLLPINHKSRYYLLLFDGLVPHGTNVMNASGPNFQLLHVSS